MDAVTDPADPQDGVLEASPMPIPVHDSDLLEVLETDHRQYPASFVQEVTQVRAQGP